MRDTITRPHPGQEVGVCSWRGGFTEATVTAVEEHSNHLGGQWVTLTLRLPDGEVVEGVDSRRHVLLGPEYHPTAWCPECRAYVEVVDTHDESHYTPRGEVGYHVQDLTCGHSLTGPETLVGPAPGGEAAAEALAQAATRARLDRQHDYDGAW